MKIVEVIPTLGYGGAERFVVDLCNELSKDNQVILIVFNLDERLPSLRNDLLPNVELIQFDKKNGFRIGLIFSLNNLLKELKPDVIHSHLGALNYLLYSCLFDHRNYFHTIHSLPSIECSKIQMLVRKYFFKFEHIFPITISKPVDVGFIQLYNLNRRKLIVNGRKIPIKSDKFIHVENEINNLKERYNQPIVFINIANIKPNKNQEMLIKVANQLESNGVNFVLLIIGSKSEDIGYFRMLSKDASERVIFKGQLTNAVDYLYFADAFCLCSKMEGAPISLLEAMSLGVIPICTPAGGVIDVIKNDVNGFISEDLSFHSYFKSIESFLCLSKSKNIIISNNARESYQNNYTMTACSKSYLELFHTKVEVVVV